MSPAQAALFVGPEIVILEKMDGGNACLSAAGLFARSHGAEPVHPSWNEAKVLMAMVERLISPGVSVFGEWVYARHSIKYTQIASVLSSAYPRWSYYFHAFGVREGTMWWAWDDTVEYAARLNVPTVPCLWRGCVESVAELRSIMDGLGVQPSVYGPEREGLVVRRASAFEEQPGVNAEFTGRVGKWVRRGHVQTSSHWKFKPIEMNE